MGEVQTRHAGRAYMGVFLFVLFLNILNDLFFLILHALVFCLHVCIYEDVKSPGTVVAESCKLPCWCWELNPGSLEDQAVSALNH